MWSETKELVESHNTPQSFSMVISKVYSGGGSLVPFFPYYCCWNVKIFQNLVIFIKLSGSTLTSQSLVVSKTSGLF